MAAIHQAAIQGDARLLRQLLTSNPGLVDAQMMVSDATPLHIVCEQGHLAAAKVLLEWKANCNARNQRGETPLHAALEHVKGNFLRAFFCARTSAAITALLLSHGAAADARNHTGDTPLHKAAMLGCGEVAEILLTHGADPNPVNDKGLTPLRTAMRYKQQKIVELLKKRGAK